MMKLYTDGGDSPEKGTYGSFLLENEDGLLIKLGRLIFGSPIETNNAAEYAALIAGLEFCIENDIKEVQAWTDSLLMVKQVHREWRVNKPHLRELTEKVWELLPHFDKIEVSYVRRKVIAGKLGH